MLVEQLPSGSGSPDGYAAHSINVLSLTGNRISAFVAFRSAALFAQLGVPAVPN